MNTNVNNANNKKSTGYYNYYQSEEYTQKHAEYQRQQKLSKIQMTLDSSCGTQTEALKKPTYRELEKQPFIARITAQLETNSHDGYCSDEDCEYTRKIVKANIVVPDDYKDCPVGEIANTTKYKWTNHLPLPDVNIGGSGYCKFHKPKGGIGQHEYRYTIKKVEIVENRKFIQNYNYEAKPLIDHDTKVPVLKPVPKTNPTPSKENVPKASVSVPKASVSVPKPVTHNIYIPDPYVYLPDYGNDAQGRQCRGW